MTATTDRAATRRRGRLLAAAGLAVMMIAVGCSDRPEVSTGPGANGSSPPLAASSAAVTEAEALFVDISDGVLGPGARADAVRYLESVGFQGLITDCMADKGFTYLGVPAFRVPEPASRYGGGILDPVDPTAVAADGMGLDATLAGLVENAKAGDPIVQDLSAEGPPPPEHEVPGWDDAMVACEPTTEELDAWVARPSYDRLLSFTDLVDGVLESEPVSTAAAAYPTCMADAGWPLGPRQDRREVTTQIREGFEALLLDASSSWSQDPAERSAQVDRLVSSDEWNQLLEDRAEAASADATCRRDAHDLALTALLDPLRAYRAEHHTEIERLRAEWAAVEERASRTPDPVVTP